jgi:ArsR family transcriptional regulator
MYPRMEPLAFFKSLSEETRLKSLLLILKKEELCVCNLMHALDLSQPKISRHLAELRKSGIVQDERRGKWVYYRLNPDLPAWARDVLLQTLQHKTDYIAHECQQLDEQSCSRDTCR